MSRRIIIVSMDGNTVFEGILNPQFDAVNELVSASVSKVIEIVLQQEIISKELQGL